MTKEDFIAQINLQKERGNKLLEQVKKMHVGRNYYGDGIAVFGAPRMYYTPREELEPIKAEYESWKLYVHDFLNTVLERDDDFVKEWDSCLRKPYLNNVSDKDWYSKEINKALSKLDSFIQRIGFRFKEKADKSGILSRTVNSMNETNKIFIVHGHNEEMKQVVARVVTRLGLEPIILHEQANEGKTIIDKFEANAENTFFAIILLSGDDLAASVSELEGLEDEEIRSKLEKRARQNVVFEMGYFAGKLGRSHMFYLLQNGVSKPGDLDGLVYTPFDAPEGTWKFELAKELKVCGYNVDANQLL